MRLITIKQPYLRPYTADREMLQKANRPCALIVQLKYKNHRYDFAVPLRSNISPSTPKEQYFPLPPRSTTKSKFRHGIHYIKMFPVRKSFISRYRTDGNVFAAMLKSIIDRNEKEIVSACQQYLADYENGKHPAYCTDIDFLLEQMQKS